MPNDRTMYQSTEGPLRDIFDTADRITRIGKLPYHPATLQTLMREMIAFSKATEAVANRCERIIAEDRRTS